MIKKLALITIIYNSVFSNKIVIKIPKNFSIEEISGSITGLDCKEVIFKESLFNEKEKGKYKYFTLEWQKIFKSLMPGLIKKLEIRAARVIIPYTFSQLKNIRTDSFSFPILIELSQNKDNQFEWKWKQIKQRPLFD